MDYEKLIAEIVRRVIEKLEMLEKQKGGGAPCSRAPEKAGGMPRKEVAFKKRVITEKDIVAARGGGASVVRVAERAILTDLAEEYAQAHEIVIERR